MAKKTQPIPFAGAKLDQARHVCAFFNSEDEEYRVLLPFIKDGFDCGHKAIHVVSPDRHDRHISRLTAAGIDTVEAQRCGQMDLRINTDAYLHEGRFEPDRMLQMFERIASGTSDNPYPLSRIVCQMEWASRHPSYIHDLIEFEARVNDVWSRHDDAVICVYDLAKFSGDTVMDVMRTHPMIIVGGTLQQNPFFVPPQEFLDELHQRRADQALSSPGRLSMEREIPITEIKRLQRCVGDLVSIMALPAMWVGREAPQVGGALLDAILGMLDLDFAHLHLKNADGDPSLAVTRLSQWASSVRTPEEFGTDLDNWINIDGQEYPSSLRLGDRNLPVFPARLGLLGEMGLMVVGSRRVDFPHKTEALLLSVAANQATIGLQTAWQLSEQKRLARELDERVEERSNELATVNEELRRRELDFAHVARVTTMGQLTASIAHELNQPLAGIVTNASTSLRMLSSTQPNITGALETARRTIRDANRATEIVSRLRALFKKNNFVVEAVNLNSATREVLTLTSSKLQRSRIKLRAELDDALPDVKGDRIQLQQVIMNLIVNAVEAMEGIVDRPKELVIATQRAEDDYARIIVRDTGVGFDSAVAEKLFQPFHTTKSDGMGIGLSVSRSIVELHQGRLWAETNDGPGATFFVSIPTGINGGGTARPL